MGYMHIENLYKQQDILLFRECYALEKIHGTSAHISWKDGNVKFFSGGAKNEEFVKLFDVETLRARFIEMGKEEVVLFGEAYGGKMQGMSHTYGKQLRFIVFDVKIDEYWLKVPSAEAVAHSFGLEFVHYNKVSTDLSSLDAERDAPSMQAYRNGIIEDKMREGVVLRPLEEFRRNDGSRIICKHKRPEFSERKSTPSIDPARREILEKADAIAEEWVTEMRLTHVLDKLGNPTDLSMIPKVIEAMIEDVTREAAGEILDSKDARKAISSLCVKLFKKRVCTIGEQP